MSKKLNSFVVGCCQLLELASIVGIAGIALKRNKDAYNAEMKHFETEMKLLNEEMVNWSNEREIERLKKKIEELENQKEVQA